MKSSSDPRRKAPRTSQVLRFCNQGWQTGAQVGLKAFADGDGFLMLSNISFSWRAFQMNFTLFITIPFANFTSSVFLSDYYRNNIFLDFLAVRMAVESSPPERKRRQASLCPPLFTASSRARGGFWKPHVRLFSFCRVPLRIVSRHLSVLEEMPRGEIPHFFQLR